METLPKLNCPESQIMAHNLAASVKARTLTSDTVKAVREYQRRMTSFHDRVRHNVTLDLNEIFGTNDPLRVVELTPPSAFEHLKLLQFGSYKEPTD